MRERDYQRALIRRIEQRFPGCMVIPNDPKVRQGIPDLLILHGPYWAMLEVKLDWDSPVQPNQAWYVETLDRLSFAAFVYPENEEEVLNALQSTFRTRGQARLPEPKPA